MIVIFDEFKMPPKRLMSQTGWKGVKTTSVVVPGHGSASSDI